MDPFKIKARCILRKGWIASGLLLGATICAPGNAKAQKTKPAQNGWGTPWSYQGAIGPAHWGDLDPRYVACRAGKEQSPVNIQTAKSVDLPSLRFEFKKGPLNIINNGYTAVRVNYAPGNGNLLIVGRERYELTQFHFHHPSEEYFRGKPYVMGIHFMYRAADGKVAAVAIPLQAGEANAAIQQLWKYMATTKGGEKRIAGVEFNPAGLLPQDTAYYTYMGSLTAPPCTEGVKWFVLRTPVDISARQIRVFGRLYPHDVRPIQPLNGRVVKESR